MALKDFINTYKKYKTLVFTIVGLIAILLPIVLVVKNSVDIVSKLKAYPYIGADVAYKNTISVSGEGKVYAKADIAIITLSVVTNGRTVKIVQEENSNKMNDVIDFLKGFSVEEKDIKTTNYRIYPQYNYEDRKVPEIIGYEISQSLEVKVREIDKVGEILQGTVDVGVNQVSSLRFWVDDDEELKEEARKLAINDAKEKAKKLASDLGVKLIKISGYNEAGDYDYPVYRATAEFGIGGGTPQIETGENEIIVNVTLIYEIN